MPRLIIVFVSASYIGRGVLLHKSVTVLHFVIRCGYAARLVLDPMLDPVGNLEKRFSHDAHIDEC